MTDVIKLTKKGRKEREGLDEIDNAILDIVEQMEKEQAKVMKKPRSKVWVNEDQVVERLLGDISLR